MSSRKVDLGDADASGSGECQMPWECRATKQRHQGQPRARAAGDWHGRSEL